MTDLTKAALKYINSKSFDEQKEVNNHFNMLIEYCLKTIPIVEDTTCDTAQVEFINKKGFIIRYNPDFDMIVDEDENKHIKKVAHILAHEALHVLLRHFDYKFDIKKDKPKLMNIAQDSQVNSYLYKMGYFDVYENDDSFKHMTIVQIVEEYRKFAKDMERYEAIKKITEDPNHDPIELSQFDDGTGIIDGLAPDPISMKLEGIILGFEKEDDVPDWEVMYKYLLKYCPEYEIEVEGDDGVGVGNNHSEWDIEAQGIYVDRIFEGFAKAIDRTIDDLTEEMKKKYQLKNLNFKMKKIAVEKLKGEWVKTLGKYLNGVNAIASNEPTWSRFSRRLGEGYIGRKVNRYQEVSVLVDVSGSMTEDIPRAIKQICEIATFVGRIKYFLTWDTEQCGEWRNINSKKLARLEIGARGGTKLGEGFKQLAKKGKTKLLIVISDMQTDEDDYNILNELSLTHDVILGLVQSDIQLAHQFFNNKVKVISIGGIPNEIEGTN